MNLSERDNFDEQWRKAFEEASEAPPPSLWDAIEEKLDEKKKKRVLILPLWWKHVPMGYAAAAVGVVLLVGWSIWSMMNQNQGQTQVAANQGAVPAQKLTDTEAPIGKKSEGKLIEEVVPELKYRPEEAVASIGQTRPKVRVKGNAYHKVIREEENKRGGFPEMGLEKESLTGASLKQTTAKSISADALAANVENGANTPGELQLIEARGFQELSVYPRRRYVFYRGAGDDYAETNLDNKPKKEYWAGVGLMPSSFDPHVNVKSAPLFSNLISNGQSISNTSAAESSTSEARLSYSVQAQTGMKISKNWSIETGISYLQGNSVFKSEGYALDKLSSRSTNVLESAIYSGTNNKAPEYMLTTGDAKTEEPAGLYIDVSQKKNNEYRYLQVPVQVGYTINPSGKLSYTVLGGMVGNFFLQNQLETNSGYVLTTKASDNVYRSLNWAGSSGLRFNFRLSPHWVMNMTGSFQQSIMTIFKDNSNLESKPQLYGVGWGMRYTF